MSDDDRRFAAGKKVRQILAKVIHAISSNLGQIFRYPGDNVWMKLRDDEVTFWSTGVLLFRPPGVLRNCGVYGFAVLR